MEGLVTVAEKKYASLISKERFTKFCKENGFDTFEEGAYEAFNECLREPIPRAIGAGMIHETRCEEGTEEATPTKKRKKTIDTDSLEIMHNNVRCLKRLWIKTLE